MRLNRVASFYPFLLCFRNEVSEEEGQPATASPHAGPVAHGKATAKAPCKGATGCSQGQPIREASGARKGRQLPIGVALAGKSATCGHSRLQRSACKGGRLQDARKGLPLAGVAASAVGVAAPW
ncbi:hypothetical protein BHE74_00029200 [Ensete ventricosum]|nr:hypothetical protein GW17_00033964 [Ensete ventricosum]RWW63608.1 hypothetical protein BHE74_00029200 [Ensete ventricosum]RZR96371.1 hypothetical protein BHM03_00025373 [Ensete ventricosum]